MLRTMDTKNKTVTVLTADIVKSTLMDDRFKQHLLKTEVKNFLEVNTSLIDYQVYRGDEFQFTIARPEDAFLVAALLRTFIITKTPDEMRYQRLYDVRIAIGIGKTSDTIEHDGEAYIISGHLMDRMKKERIAVDTAWKEANELLSLHAMTIDAIISKWSKRQAEIMLEVLLDVPRDRILSDMNISNPTLSSFLKKSDAKLLKKIIKHSSKIISENIKEDFQDIRQS